MHPIQHKRQIKAHERFVWRRLIFKHMKHDADEIEKLELQVMELEIDKNNLTKKLEKNGFELIKADKKIKDLKEENAKLKELDLMTQILNVYNPDEDSCEIKWFDRFSDLLEEINIIPPVL